MNIKLEIPENFYEGEEKCGYYVSPEMKKVWAVELDLLAEFGRICEKHGLKWWINYGTLLGAVRHKGFIPWDDDVDVVMMREDYEKLCGLYADEFRHPYRLMSPFDREYRSSVFTFSKLYNEDTALFEHNQVNLLKNGRKPTFSRGIYIDIFPMYDIPDDDRELHLMLKKASTLKAMAAKYQHISDEYYYPSDIKWKRPLQAILRATFKVTGFKPPYIETFGRLMDITGSFVQPDSKNLIVWHDVPGSLFNTPKTSGTYITSRSFFDETTILPFEMLRLPAPQRYDELLRHYYGDWHELKITHYHGVFYDAERSYKYYDEKGILPGQEQA